VGDGGAGSAGRSATPALRLPNTRFSAYFERFKIFWRSGLIPERRTLVSGRPVKCCAMFKNISADLCLPDISPIIWPLFAAAPKIAGSNGITASG
jgi:hypothetical protein